VLDEAFALAERQDDPTAMSVVVWARSWLDRLQGHPERVIASAEPLLDHPRADLWYHLTLGGIVAGARAELGQMSEAEVLARDVVETARKARINLLAVAALPPLGHALSRQGRSTEAQEVLAEAIAQSHEMPEPFTEAHARYEWGRVLSQAGDAQGAREQLDAALTIFKKLGARPFVELTAQALTPLQTAQEADPA
jgi:tetratricopeptide (TPR) repeat protein